MKKVKHHLKRNKKDEFESIRKERLMKSIELLTNKFFQHELIIVGDFNSNRAEASQYLQKLNLI
jgi:hypothetical protein